MWRVTGRRFISILGAGMLVATACVLCLFPNVRDDEEIIQELLSKVLHVSGKMLLVFDRMGTCTWLCTSFDFVAALQRALGCLAKVNACLQGANISSSTGRISPTTLPILLSERNQGSRSAYFDTLAH